MANRRFILFVFFILAFCRIEAQESVAKEMKSPDLVLIGKKINGGKLQVSARLSWFENRMDHPVAGAPVDIIIGQAEQESVSIPGILTDREGFAEAIIDSGAFIPKDKEGFITLMASFSGNDSIEAARSEVRFREAFLQMQLNLVDSVKMIMVSAHWINHKGELFPLEYESVSVSVQRMFSLLPVGDAMLDEFGQGMIEFPANLPGDSIGIIELVASLSDHEIYGNAEYRLFSDWGLPKEKIVVDHRTLWSHIAPVWMIISLTVMLFGVWAHYLFVVLQLIRIRNKGKQLNPDI